MKAIYKYQLTGGETEVEMPCGARVLAVQCQGNTLCLWAEVDPDEKAMTKRMFKVIGTGEFTEDREATARIYIGTVQAGIFVWHIFEV